MTSTRRDWSSDHRIDGVGRVLVEASAGTGKTWQIEGIVVRLLAEAGIEIERIVAITFTEAAAADLRHRVRRRIAAARDALLGVRAVPDDEVVERLCRADREVRAHRLDRALAAFDRAAISTIHSFCRRLLEQLAFESGQEPDLAVRESAAEVLARLVADERARVYASAGPLDLAWLETVGWTEEALKEVARLATGPVPLDIVPPPPEGMDALGAARAWWAEIEAFKAWGRSAEGKAAMRSLVEEGPARIRGLTSERLGQIRADLRGWLANAPVDPRDLADRWSHAALLRHWDGTEDELVTFVGREVFLRFDELIDARRRLAAVPLGAFAVRVRAACHDELDRRAALTFDGMLEGLAARLDGAGADHPLVRAVRARFAVALVDEFQDTDSAQWCILRALFADTRLYTIGDPKQAIYKFRSADLDVYLEACAGQDLWDLTRCHRSDGPLVDALNRLWAGPAGARYAPFGDRIAYVPVHSPHGVRISGLPAVQVGERTWPRSPLELRWFDWRDFGNGSDSGSPPGFHKARAWLTERCAEEVQRLLASRALVQGEEIAPRHIGVLVRTNDQAELVRAALADREIPAVTGGRGSVFSTDAAAWIVAWLHALASERDADARWLALTPLGDWTLAELGTALDGGDGADRWGAFREDLRRQAAAWPMRGFARVFDETLRGWNVLPRIVGSAFGERAATDLRHLLELCHAEERKHRHDPLALAEWLRAAAKPGGSEGTETQPLRLESDALAVQIVTIHKAKGLEYPICLYPFASVPVFPPKGPFRVRVPGHAGPCLVVAADDAPERASAAAAHEQADIEEATRLLYVALTRARHHVVAWLGAEAGEVPLVRLVAGGPTAFQRTWGVRDANARRLANKAAANRVTTSIERLVAPGSHIGWAYGREPRPPPWTNRARPGARTVLPWPGRALAGGWSVASYSSIARTMEGAEPEIPAFQGRDRAGEDPVEEEAVAERVLDPALGRPVPWAGTPAGIPAGEWVHAILEYLDFSSGRPKEGGELDALARDLAARNGVPAEHVATVVPLVPGWLDTPLDAPQVSVPAGFRLRDLTVAHRLDELPFDLRVGAGTRRVAPGALGAALREDAAVAAVREGLAGSAFGAKGWADGVLATGRILPALAGILTGFMDLVFRTGGRGEDATYFVSDYKSNRVTTGDGIACLGTFTRPWLEAEMDRAGYHLQALVYTVALHRHLKQRLGPAYRYDRHVGGHLYLFLRGMIGADAPRRDGAALGVYADRWPERVVVGLDAALDGASPDDVRRAMDAVP